MLIKTTVRFNPYNKAPPATKITLKRSLRPTEELGIYIVRIDCSYKQ